MTSFGLRGIGVGVVVPKRRGGLTNSTLMMAVEATRIVDLAVKPNLCSYR